MLLLAIIAVGLFAYQVITTSMWRTARMAGRSTLMPAAARDNLAEFGAICVMAIAVLCVIFALISAPFGLWDYLFHVDTRTVYIPLQVPNHPR
jgi:hypothetical protein